MAVLITVELANKLIAHYEKCIAEVARCVDLRTAIAVCVDCDTHQGLCYFVVMRFGYRIDKCDWLRLHYTKNSNWVCGSPYRASTVQAVINRLQYRVDLLKSFIQHPTALP